jgi:hypothetical protein
LRKCGDRTELASSPDAFEYHVAGFAEAPAESSISSSHSRFPRAQPLVTRRLLTLLIKQLPPPVVIVTF